MTFVTVVGVDLSLRSTGVAGRGWCDRITPRGIGLARLRAVREAVFDYARSADLVVLEGPSYGSVGAGQHERAGLWWLIYDGLRAADIPVAVAPPACRAKYATGRGNATKDAVLLAAAKRYPTFGIDGNDQADAVILGAMAADWLGEPWAPVPAANRAALDGVRWPDITPTCPGCGAEPERAGPPGDGYTFRLHPGWCRRHPEGPAGPAGVVR